MAHKNPSSRHRVTPTLVAILALAVLSILSSALGVYLFYRSRTAFAIEHFHTTSHQNVDLIDSLIESRVANIHTQLRQFASIPDIQVALSTKQLHIISRCNPLLKFINDFLEADTCYLTDTWGTVQAASNYDTYASFVGLNISDRPYYKAAMDESSAMYPAVEKNNGTRRIYFSEPVYQYNSSTQRGVLIAEINPDILFAQFGHARALSLATTTPDGLVFTSNVVGYKWHMKWLWPVDKTVSEALSEEGRFGSGPWSWTGLTRKDGDIAVTADGRRFFVHQKDISVLPGWHLFLFQDLDALSQNVFTPAFMNGVYIAAGLCLLISLLSIFLYHKARQDILLRHQITTALINSEKRLLELSVTDALTGLLNRRGFMSAARQRLKLMDRLEGRLFLFYADLDNMKPINDQLGHAIGDQALKDTASILSSTFRESDIISRLGGDEFAVLLSTIGQDETAASVTVRFQEKLTGFNDAETRPFRLAISCGVVTVAPRDKVDIEALLRQADHLMYTEKEKKKGKGHGSSRPTKTNPATGYKLSQNKSNAP